jgi:murein DD-endopeptidase MepM/ murein hydrolase activator NlpD
VPSARAGQQTDPAARRDALYGLLSGGFLVTVIAVVLAIVVATPQYAEPATAADELPADAVASLEPEDEGPALIIQAPPTSDPPDELRGYVWPVRGGSIDTYYAPHPKGDFQVDGKRIHDGLVVTWFEGATVKAAHKGKVVAAGRDWARHVGFDGPMDKVYARYAKVEKGQKKGGKSKKPQFPLGVVVKDGNGYYSVYTELKDLLVKPGDKVKPGQPIGRMSASEKKFMMRYRLVRMDGPLMRVHEAARERGYPEYARERVDPLVVLNLKAKRKPKMKRQPPADPPRLSDY